jgi:hypothetical protein
MEPRVGFKFLEMTPLLVPEASLQTVLMGMGRKAHSPLDQRGENPTRCLQEIKYQEAQARTVLMVLKSS